MVRRGWEERVRADPGWVSGGCRGRGLHGPEPPPVWRGSFPGRGSLCCARSANSSGSPARGSNRSGYSGCATTSDRGPWRDRRGGSPRAPWRIGAGTGGRTRPTRKELAHHVDDEEVTSAYSSARMRSAIAAPHATPRRAGSPSPVASHPLPWCARTRSQAQGGACLARRGRSARLRPEITPSSGRQAGSVPLCGCPLSSTDARLF